MKNLSFWLMGLVVLIAVSCGFKSEVQPLTEDLELFTEQNEDSKEVLMGVRDSETKDVVIFPGTYLSISADKYTIVCKDKDSTIVVYTTWGDKLGEFDTFNHWEVDGDYYLGTSYGNWCFYFPKQTKIISTKAIYQGLEYLFVERNGTWEICDYYGEFISNIPYGCILIKELKPDKSAEEYYYIEEIGEGAKTVYTLYDIQNVKIKSYTAKQWKLVSKKLNPVQDVDGLTIVSAERVTKL